MLEFDWVLVVGLGMSAFLAGLFDAMVGGGGLLQLPALFTAMPSASPATLLGTNKLSSIFGTMAAARSYARRVSLEWRVVLPAAFMAWVGGFSGAWVVSYIPTEQFRVLLPIGLGCVAIYTFAKKDFGLFHKPKSRRGRVTVLLAASVGLVIGFYDGVFGPGTGSFLMLGFVALFGFDFLSASANAKVVNVACNLAALAWFVPEGSVLVGLGLTMALFNIVGAMTGVWCATRFGVILVRRVFLVLVVCLIGKTSFDAATILNLL